MARARKKAVDTIHVGLVLDRSGSMGSVWPEAVEALNDYARGLQKDRDAATTYFTLRVFDTEHDLIHDDVPVVEVAPFMGTEFPPRGGTALNDAIAGMIVHLEGKVAEAEKAMIVVLTDGFENSSVEYSEKNGKDGRARLAKVVRTYEERGNWTFVWLGANDPNVHVNAQTYGLRAGNVAAYSTSPEGFASASSTLSEVTATRKRATGMSTNSAFADAGQSQDIRDEDDKQEPEPPRRGTVTQGDISDYLS